MAFCLVRSSIRTRDFLNCLRRTIQSQNTCPFYCLKQNLRPSTEKLLASQQKYYATFSKSQYRFRVVFGGNANSGPLLTIRSHGPGKVLVRFMTDGSKSTKKNLTSALYIASFGIFMLGMAYLGIPLYRMFCQAFGVGGTSALNPTKGHDVKKVQTMKKVEGRELTVRFLADTAATMKWDFRPQQHEVRIAPGETALAFYTARNPTDKPIVGISTYSVLPNKAAQYFNKIQCFCFEEQILNPHEQVDMPVFFYIDPEIDDDIYLEDVDQIILSYTFFEAKEGLTLPLPGFPEQKPSNANPL